MKSSDNYLDHVFRVSDGLSYSVSESGEVVVDMKTQVPQTG